MSAPIHAAITNCFDSTDPMSPLQTDKVDILLTTYISDCGVSSQLFFKTLINHLPQKVTSIMQYAIDKNYFKQNDYQIELVYALTIGMTGDVGMSFQSEFETFIWICRNVLTPETIRTYRFNGMTLFHISMCGSYVLSNVEMKTLFSVFDNAQFDYIATNIASYIIRKQYVDCDCIDMLVARGIQLNTPDVFKTIVSIMLEDMCPLKIDTGKYRKTLDNDNIIAFYHHVYNSDELLCELFPGVCVQSDDYCILKRVRTIASQFGIVSTYDCDRWESCVSSYFDNAYARSLVVRSSDILCTQYITFFTNLIKRGFDLTHVYQDTDFSDFNADSFYPMTLLGLYCFCSRPIAVLNPDVHEAFIELFTV